MMFWRTLLLPSRSTQQQRLWHQHHMTISVGCGCGVVQRRYCSSSSGGEMILDRLLTFLSTVDPSSVSGCGGGGGGSLGTTLSRFSDELCESIDAVCSERTESKNSPPAADSVSLTPTATTQQMKKKAVQQPNIRLCIFSSSVNDRMISRRTFDSLPAWMTSPIAVIKTHPNETASPLRGVAEEPFQIFEPAAHECMSSSMNRHSKKMSSSTCPLTVERLLHWIELTEREDISRRTFHLQQQHRDVPLLHKKHIRRSSVTWLERDQIGPAARHVALMSLRRKQQRITSRGGVSVSTDRDHQKGGAPRQDKEEDEEEEGETSLDGCDIHLSSLRVVHALCVRLFLFQVLREVWGPFADGDSDGRCKSSAAAAAICLRKFLRLRPTTAGQSTVTRRREQHRQHGDGSSSNDDFALCIDCNALPPFTSWQTSCMLWYAALRGGSTSYSSLLTHVCRTRFIGSRPRVKSSSQGGTTALQFPVSRRSVSSARRGALMALVLTCRQSSLQLVPVKGLNAHTDHQELLGVESIEGMLHELSLAMTSSMGQELSSSSTMDHALTAWFLIVSFAKYVMESCLLRLSPMRCESLRQNVFVPVLGRIAIALTTTATQKGNRCGGNSDVGEQERDSIVKEWEMFAGMTWPLRSPGRNLVDGLPLVLWPPNKLNEERFVVNLMTWTQSGAAALFQRLSAGAQQQKLSTSVADASRDVDSTSLSTTVAAIACTHGYLISRCTNDRAGGMGHLAGASTCDAPLPAVVEAYERVCATVRSAMVSCFQQQQQQRLRHQSGDTVVTSKSSCATPTASCRSLSIGVFVLQFLKAHLWDVMSLAEDQLALCITSTTHHNGSSHTYFLFPVGYVTLVMISQVESIGEAFTAADLRDNTCTDSEASVSATRTLSNTLSFAAEEFLCGHRHTAPVFSVRSFASTRFVIRFLRDIAEYFLEEEDTTTTSPDSNNDDGAAAAAAQLLDTVLEYSHKALIERGGGSGQSLWQGAEVSTHAVVCRSGWSVLEWMPPRSEDFEILRLFVEQRCRQLFVTGRDHLPETSREVNRGGANEKFLRQALALRVGLIPAHRVAKDMTLTLRSRLAHPAFCAAMDIAAQNLRTSSVSIFLSHLFYDNVTGHSLPDDDDEHYVLALDLLLYTSAVFVSYPPAQDILQGLSYILLLDAMAQLHPGALADDDGSLEEPSLPRSGTREQLRYVRRREYLRLHVIAQCVSTEIRDDGAVLFIKRLIHQVSRGRVMYATLASGVLATSSSVSSKSGLATDIEAGVVVHVVTILLRIHQGVNSDTDEVERVRLSSGMSTWLASAIERVVDSRTPIASVSVLLKFLAAVRLLDSLQLTTSSSKNFMLSQLRSPRLFPIQLHRFMEEWAKHAHRSNLRASWSLNDYTCACRALSLCGDIGRVVFADSTIVVPTLRYAAELIDALHLQVCSTETSTSSSSSERENLEEVVRLLRATSDMVVVFVASLSSSHNASKVPNRLDQHNCDGAQEEENPLTPLHCGSSEIPRRAPHFKIRMAASELLQSIMRAVTHSSPAMPHHQNVTSRDASLRRSLTIVFPEVLSAACHCEVPFSNEDEILSVCVVFERFFQVLMFSSEDISVGVLASFIDALHHFEAACRVSIVVDECAVLIRQAALIWLRREARIVLMVLLRSNLPRNDLNDIGGDSVVRKHDGGDDESVLEIVGSRLAALFIGDAELFSVFSQFCLRHGGIAVGDRLTHNIDELTDITSRCGAICKATSQLFGLV